MVADDRDGELGVLGDQAPVEERPQVVPLPLPTRRREGVVQDGIEEHHVAVGRA